jgi:hypothetical protein
MGRQPGAPRIQRWTPRRTRRDRGADPAFTGSSVAFVRTARDASRRVPRDHHSRSDKDSSMTKNSSRGGRRFDSTPTPRTVDHLTHHAESDRHDLDHLPTVRFRAGRWLRRTWTQLTRRYSRAGGAVEPDQLPAREVVARRAAGRTFDPALDAPYGSPGDVSVISARSRAWLAELTRQGWNVGTAPYGYTAHTVTLVDRDERERRRSRLVPEPVQAEVVRQIFIWRAAAGLTLEEIVQRLRRDPRRYPPPTPRRADRRAQWRVPTVHNILTNFKYTGYQVWNYRDGQGGIKPADQWVISAQPVHQAVVAVSLFWAAQNPTTASVRAFRHRLLAAEGHRRCA